MLLMSKNLEGRIGPSDGEVFDSKIIFKDQSFPCSLIKTEIDFEENRKILKLKVSSEIMEHIYDGAVPIGLNRLSGKLSFADASIYRITCEKLETFAGLSMVLTLEVAK